MTDNDKVERTLAEVRAKREQEAAGIDDGTAMAVKAIATWFSRDAERTLIPPQIKTFPC
jgi:hypothetical protein